jgi:histone arginine demethylase JMJD6
MSVEDFIERYEKPALPVIIEGIPKAESWAAVENWDLGKLNRRYRNRRLKCGEDDDGYSVRVKLKHFLQYMENQTDDSPLYVFDSSYDDDPKNKSLLQDYAPPSYFREDLFKLIGEKRRPPYRWFLIGPKRSGTNVHIDPLGTSAWNTLIQGRKRWVVFHPSIAKKVVKGDHHFGKDDDDEAIHWFSRVLPKIIEEGGKTMEAYEFIQRPGDTIFIPGGWWHAVLNIDDTVAVTQNFASTACFEKVWLDARKGRRKMAIKWLAQLDIHYPSLGKLARHVNERDGFDLHQSRKKRKLDAKAQAAPTFSSLEEANAAGKCWWVSTGKDCFKGVSNCQYCRAAAASAPIAPSAQKKHAPENRADSTLGKPRLPTG